MNEQETALAPAEAVAADKPRTMKARAEWFWREWIKPLLIVGLVLGSFRSSIADWNDVPSGSMKPTIVEGDRVFVNKVAYDLKIPFTTYRVTQWETPSAATSWCCTRRTTRSG